MQTQASGVASCTEGSDGNAVTTDHATIRRAIDALLGDREALGRLYRLAERTARLPPGASLARELVCDAMGDLLLGETGCDAATAFDAQLRSAVRRRARQLLPGRRETQVVALDTAPDSALAVEPREADVAPEDAELGGRIREQAREDEAALQLLALYERGIVRRRDVLRSGMDAWCYHAARQRLARYATVAMSGGPMNSTPLSGQLPIDD
jgi:hypothetical protein